MNSNNVLGAIFSTVGIMLIIGVIALFSSFAIIPTGHTGVVVQFGRVTGRELSSGFNFKAPWQSVWKADIQVQKEQVEAQAASLDLQVVHATLALNYHLDSAKVGEIFRTLGKQYKNRVIDPAIQEAFKAVSAKFTAAELLQKRAEVKQLADVALAERLGTRGIVVDDLSIVNFDFSKDFNDAIEAKQVAQQQAEQAKYKLEQAKLDAQAQESQKTSLTQEILTKMFLEKWDGHLPQAMGSNSIFGLNFK